MSYGKQQTVRQEFKTQQEMAVYSGYVRARQILIQLHVSWTAFMSFPLPPQRLDCQVVRLPLYSSPRHPLVSLPPPWLTWAIIRSVATKGLMLPC